LLAGFFKQLSCFQRIHGVYFPLGHFCHSRSGASPAPTSWIWFHRYFTKGAPAMLNICFITW
jgi:hypothetical protein